MMNRLSIRPLFAALVATMFVACADNVEQQANPYLERAQQSFANGQYHLAKLQLDSLKELYPKAFDARAKAQTMLLQIDLTESQRNLCYVDSLLTLSQEMAQKLIPQFYLDKDAKYQDIGNYYASRYRVEQNTGRTYLRPQTDEKGKFAIVIYYRGKSIQPHTLRFTAPDGTFTEVTAPTSHSWTDASGRTERLDFLPAEDSSIASFVAMHADNNIKVELIGANSKSVINFAKADKQSLVEVASLATCLRNIATLEAQQQEACRRIEFFRHRLQADSLKRATANNPS